MLSICTRLKNLPFGRVKSSFPRDVFILCLFRLLYTVLEVKKVATNSDYVFPNASEAVDYEEDWVQNTTSGLTLPSENLQGMYEITFA